MKKLLKDSQNELLEELQKVISQEFQRRLWRVQLLEELLPKTALAGIPKEVPAEIIEFFVKFHKKIQGIFLNGSQKDFLEECQKEVFKEYQKQLLEDSQNKILKHSQKKLLNDS